MVVTEPASSVAKKAISHEIVLKVVVEAELAIIAAKKVTWPATVSASSRAGAS